LLSINWITTSNYTCLQKNTKQQVKEIKQKQKKIPKGDRDDEEEKEYEVDEQEEALSSDSSLESDEDSDAPVAAQPPHSIETLSLYLTVQLKKLESCHSKAETFILNEIENSIDFLTFY
jgi:hypothetical protein